MNGNTFLKFPASSARHHVPGRAATLKLIIFGVLSTFGHVASIVPVGSQWTVVAMGEQPGQPPAALELRADGRSILFAGRINEGAANRLDVALQIAPTVTTVILASGGGYVSEGELLANVIQKRGLNTYVETHCASACTIAFLAGKERAAAPSAKIGFHSGRIVGSAGIFYEEKNDRLRALYQNAGLPDAFVRQALGTSNQKMWYPRHEELQTVGVLTRNSAGEPTATLSTPVRYRAVRTARLDETDRLTVLEKPSPEDIELAPPMQ